MAEIRKLLIANRGEIAWRIHDACADRHIQTVAVYSEADADLPFVREADEAVCIGPGPSAESYLRIDAILDAARRTGADAIHPGYGFLAENPAFAQAVLDAGLIWVGPSPEAMRALGDKASARKLAAGAGVPVVPGYDGDAQDDATMAAEAAKIGVPLLVKASAGGGGRGMRRVDDLADLPEALASARREAAGAFGDDRLLLERYVTRPRHVEVQVMGLPDGTVLTLGERDCSVQRRHQKIVEESPAPGLSDETRAALAAAARTVAEAVRYVNAGTVEFVVSGDASFYFLEMNTRLQVEHPVTEMRGMLDLVDMQLDVAQGTPWMSQDMIDAAFLSERHAIEVRLYAEDPLRDWMPVSGRLVHLVLPDHLEGVRVDAGYGSGDTVPVHYDSMIAKIIAVGEDKTEALRALRAALRHTWAPGLSTNLSLLRDLVDDEAFVAGDVHTGILAERGLPRVPPTNHAEGATLAALLHATALAAAAPHPPAPLGFRLQGPQAMALDWSFGGEALPVTCLLQGDDVVLTVDGDDPVRGRVLARDGDEVRVLVDGHQRTVRVARSGGSGPFADGETVYLHLGHGEAMVQLVPRFPPPAGLEDDPGSCTAPTPGVIRAVHVAVGDAVAEGQLLVVLEAMKMEHGLRAPMAGVVEGVLCGEGDSVTQGTLLVRIGIEPEA